MAAKKYHIEKNTIQETLIIPLWGRKFATEIYGDIYRDPKAVEIASQLDYDFGTLEGKTKSFGFRFGYLESAARYADLAVEIKDYIKAHPKAAVVNLGCGLDCTAENNATVTNKIYNIDRPDVIDVRNELLPPDGRTVNIGADLNDTAWFDQIDSTDGAVFFAAGVFYYFLTDEVKALFTAMEKRFKGCCLVFDCANQMAVKMMLKTFVKTAGITDVTKYFYVNDPAADLTPWFKGAKVTAKGYMTGYIDLKSPSISGPMRFLSRVGDGMMKMRIAKIEF